MGQTLTYLLAWSVLASPMRARVGPQDLLPWGAYLGYLTPGHLDPCYLHCSTSLWASSLVFTMGATEEAMETTLPSPIPQAPASRARPISAGVLSATLMIGKK